MNKHYIYILSDTRKQSIHVGYCKDILKAVKLFGEMPTVLPSPERQNVLVHLEISDNEQDAKSRFEEIFRMNLSQKLNLIIEQNPYFVEILPGINMDI